jgi:cysteinyl-tRNA synthetase
LIFLTKAKEGEGVLSTDDSEKKTKFDFALWKKSKEGEPKWNSPWYLTIVVFLIIKM